MNMEDKKEIEIPSCNISWCAGNPRCQMYSVHFADGLSGDLFAQDGYYIPTPDCMKPSHLGSFKTVDEAVIALYGELRFRRDDPEGAAAAEKAREEECKARKDALEAAKLFHFEKNESFDVYRAQDIKYEIVPYEELNRRGLTTSCSHLPLFAKKKYYFKSTDGVHAFTPIESFFGFRLLLGGDLDSSKVKVATRCTIDGVDGDCLIVADYAQSADADRADHMSPYDDFGGFAYIWSERPHFHPTEEAAINGTPFCAPKLRRSYGRLEHKEEAE